MKSETGTKGFAVIVYPEESGTLLAPAFLKHNIECLCITRQQTLTCEINRKDYHAIIPNKGELSTLLATLKEYPLLCVLPGSERGVPVADQISAKLNLLSNAHQHAEARCNKSIMAKTAHDAGLKVPTQTPVESETQLNALISNGLDWPVILKPATSMGSEDVNLCANAEELHHAFKSVLNTENRLGRKNRQCIVQEYLKGTEYAIDTVSYAGSHHVTAIWRYHKSSDQIIGIVPFNSKQLLNENGPIQQLLLSYTYQLLDALGIQYGPAHAELVIENNIVQLMEIGARLHGGTPAMQMSDACSGQSQVDLCATAYANPKIFLKKQSTLYKLFTHGEIVLLIAPHDGLRINAACVETISALPSVESIDVDTTTTHSQGQIVGLIRLKHVSRHTMASVLKSIRDMEASDLYTQPRNLTVID